MIGACRFRCQQQEDEVNRLVIERLEIDRALQPCEETKESAQFRKLAMRNRHTTTDAGRAELFTLKQDFQNFLFALSRQGLLGEDIFKFFEDGEELKSSLEYYCREGREAGLREITRHTVRNIRGETTEVDLAISVSCTDTVPMFTAILRRRGES